MVVSRMTIIIGNLLALVVMGAIWLTGFLFEDGSRNNGLIDRVCVEGHVVCVAYVIDPQLFVGHRVRFSG